MCFCNVVLKVWAQVYVFVLYARVISLSFALNVKNQELYWVYILQVSGSFVNRYKQSEGLQVITPRQCELDMDRFVSCYVFF